METHKDSLDRLTGILWGVTLLCLPVTSFPTIPFISKGTEVRPLSIYPMLLLFPLLLIQMWRKRIKVWHPIFTPLTVFVLIVLGTTLTASFFAPIGLHGMEFDGRVLRAAVTLLIGIAFFTYSLWNNQTLEQFSASLKWLYLGLFLSFIWGILQMLVYYGWLLNESILDQYQKIFSVSGVSLKNLRVTGFAFEPSWLAGQIAILYLPWLLTSLLTGFRVTRWRWLELVLTGMALFLLVETYSRSGIVIVLAVCLVTMLLFGREKFKQIWDWWQAPFHRTDQRGRSNQMAAIGSRLLILVLLLTGIGSSVHVLGSNPYFSKFWNSKKTNLVEYVIDNYAGPRLAYAMAGLETFDQHPWSGVGLGAGGLYLYPNLPDWSKTFIPETAIQLSPLSTAYPNSKNMFIRLLSESGILGLGAFLGFLLNILGRILTFRNSNELKKNFLVISGVFSWMVIILFCFTQDSFAMPITWINFGMLLGLAGSSINPMQNSIP